MEKEDKEEEDLLEHKGIIELERCDEKQIDIAKIVPSSIRSKQ